MSELANYSIETDHTVLLLFKDGRSLRVATAQLPRHLTPQDLAKVRAAIKLRNDFIRQHMPKASIVLIAAGLIALMLAGSRVVASLFNRPTPEQPDPATKTGIVRSVELPSPSVTPSPQVLPPVVALGKPSPKPVSHRTARRLARSTPLKPLANSTKPTAATSTTPATPMPAPSPEPSITPMPSTSPAPTPVPSTAPIADQSNPTPGGNQSGQVLGDSTGPTPPGGN